MPRSSTRSLIVLAFWIAFACLNEASAADLKVVSFNLYNRPWERTARLATALTTLQSLGPDVVALQEVAQGWFLRGDPVALFAGHLKMHSARHWHEKNLGIFRTGLAILSRYPIISSEYHEFAQHPFWDAKGYLFVRIAAPSGMLQVINLHMASTNNQRIRESEWKELTEFVLKQASQGPVLLAGDFNTEPGHPALTAFVQATQAASIYDGWPALSERRSWTPNYRDSCARATDPESGLLDWVFVAPAASQGTTSLSILRGQIIEHEQAPHPSDHCAIFSEVRQQRAQQPRQK